MKTQSTRRKSEKQPLSPLSYALFSLVAFMVGITLLMLYIFKADDLIAQVIDEKVFYILLLPMGLSASAFLFGVMQSYAVLIKKEFSIKLKLGGPVVLFILVVIGGFQLVPSYSSFPQTIYVHGNKGKHNIVLKNEGDVIIYLGNDRQIKKIGEYGEAYFPSIPPEFRNQQVHITVIAENFELANADTQYILSGKNIYILVKKDESLARIFGIVTDENNTPLEMVVVQIGDLQTTTDKNGYFIIDIPLEKRKKQQKLRAYKKEYEIWECFVYPKSGQEIEIILIRKNPSW